MSAHPDPTELARLLRSCVQCGLCLPTCATWEATGNEVLSPRGRLVLMQQFLDGVEPGTEHDPEPGSEPSPEALRSFDQCIGCRACESACPSGVPFSLFEYGKDLAAGARRAGSLVVERPAVPQWLLKRLDRPAVLRGLKALAPLVAAGPPQLAQLARALPAAPAQNRTLIALLDSLTGIESRGYLETSAKAATNGTKVAFFTGCANGALMPATSRRLIGLLRQCGCEVQIPAAQGCCGALAAHTCRARDRERLHQNNRRAFGRAHDGQWVVVEAAGCGLELKEQDDFGGAVVLDSTEVLLRLLPLMRSVPLRVAYHGACHLEHGQGVSEAPRALLRTIPGLELVEPEDPALCCGSGGVWSLEHPDLAAEIGARKARALLDTGAQLVVTTNPGCLGQIRGALSRLDADLPLLPLTDLIWYACLN